MTVEEIEVKTVLVKSAIPGADYVINPYKGCAHGCAYCYAGLMRSSLSGGSAGWGSYVKAKVNLPEVLERQLARCRKQGHVMLSSVCDPYQPAEERYQLTRQSLILLRYYGWSTSVLTRSPLVLRDKDIFRSMLEIDIGFSIPTDDDVVRMRLEPAAPSIPERINALKELHSAGIKTWVFVAPVLPMDPDRLADLIAPYAAEVLIDHLNYKTRFSAVFRKAGYASALSGDFAPTMVERLRTALGKENVPIL